MLIMTCCSQSPLSAAELTNDYAPDSSPSEKVNHWRSLHRYAASLDDLTFDPVAAEAYYTNWYNGISTEGECKANWDTLVTENPVDYSSALNFELWCWQRHDDVSRVHSRRRRISFERCQAIYRGPRYGWFTSHLYLSTQMIQIISQMREAVDFVGLFYLSHAGDVNSIAVPIYSSAQELIDNVDTIVVDFETTNLDTTGKTVLGGSIPFRMVEPRMQIDYPGLTFYGDLSGYYTALRDVQVAIAID